MPERGTYLPSILILTVLLYTKPICTATTVPSDGSTDAVTSPDPVTVATTTPMPVATTEGTKSPEILNQPLVVNLLESTDTETELTCITCTDPDGADTEVKINSTSLSSLNISQSLFAVWKNDGSTEYCVYFTPGGGKLSYTDTPIIHLPIQCSDSVDPPTSADLEVRLQPNYPPEFTKTSDIVEVDVKNGDSFSYKLDELATDVTEGDELTYTIHSTPDLQLFHVITDTDGKSEIQLSQDLSTVCNSSLSPVSMDLMVSDGFNDPVEGMKITFNLNGLNEPPTLTNMNVEESITEHSPIGTEIYEITNDDVDQPDDVQYSLTVAPPQYSGAFAMSQHKLILKETLNYETQESFNITVKPSDGYCEGPAAWIKINVVDENDPITLTLADPIGHVEEGNIKYDPVPQYNDEDRLDAPVYSLLTNTDEFTIDSVTGVIESKGKYDRDGKNPESVELKIRATDKGGNYSEATLTLNVEEINDNAPVISDTSSLLAESMTCSDVGILDIQLPSNIDDDDKTGSVNSETEYIATSSGPLAVTKDGKVYLTSTPRAGFYSVDVYARDHGVNPGPLTSATSITVSLVVTDCTTTTIPVTQSVNVIQQSSRNGGSANSNIQNTSQNQTSSSSFNTDYLWIALGSLLGLLLLGLLSWLLYKCCCSGGFGGGCGSMCGGSNGCCGSSSRCCGDRCCLNERALTPLSTNNKVKPSTPFDEEDTVKGVELYDFWKEHYWEDNMMSQPNRLAIPASMGSR